MNLVPESPIHYDPVAPIQGDDADPSAPDAEPAFAALKIPSNLSAKDLEKLLPFFRLPSGYSAFVPKSSNHACFVPLDPREIYDYVEAMLHGLRFPLHPFFVKLLRHYGICLSQLPLNAWSNLCGFVMQCRSVDTDPTVELFNRQFILRTFGGAGFYYLSARTGCDMYGSQKPDSLKFWKQRLFVLRLPNIWPLQREWDLQACSVVGRPIKNLSEVEKIRLRSLDQSELTSAVFMTRDFW